MKKQLKKDADLTRWCDMLTQSSVKPEPVPEGWFTIAALAAELEKSHCNTSERVRRLVSQGLAERKEFVIQLEQRVRKVPHYRLK